MSTAHRFDGGFTPNRDPSADHGPARPVLRRPATSPRRLLLMKSVTAWTTQQSAPARVTAAHKGSPSRPPSFTISRTTPTTINTTRTDDRLHGCTSRNVDGNGRRAELRVCGPRGIHGRCRRPRRRRRRGAGRGARRRRIPGARTGRRVGQVDGRRSTRRPSIRRRESRSCTRCSITSGPTTQTSSPSYEPARITAALFVGAVTTSAQASTWRRGSPASRRGP